MTDEHFFQGSDEYLEIARDATNIPVLRKDFILDEYQVLETRSLNADCILLIVGILKEDKLGSLYEMSRSLGLDVLLEVHTREELERALKLHPRMVGINNRNLTTFETSLMTTINLLELVPDEVLVVSESGIHSPDDVKLLVEHGVGGFLVGESLMRAKHPGEQLEHLFA